MKHDCTLALVADIFIDLNGDKSITTTGASPGLAITTIWSTAGDKENIMKKSTLHFGAYRGDHCIDLSSPGPPS